MTGQPVRRILVVKLGGFSDFVLAFDAFNASRRNHADAHIILMTTRRFGELARKSGWFESSNILGALNRSPGAVTGTTETVAPGDGRLAR